MTTCTVERQEEDRLTLNDLLRWGGDDPGVFLRGEHACGASQKLTPIGQATFITVRPLEPFLEIAGKGGVRLRSGWDGACQDFEAPFHLEVLQAWVEERNRQACEALSTT